MRDACSFVLEGEDSKQHSRTSHIDRHSCTAALRSQTGIEQQSEFVKIAHAQVNRSQQNGNRTHQGQDGTVLVLVLLFTSICTFERIVTPVITRRAELLVGFLSVSDTKLQVGENAHTS